MKWFLVVYFLIGNTWYPGDVVAPDGWSSIGYDTEDECIKKQNFMNNGFIGTDAENTMISRCQQEDPKSLLLYNS